MALILLCMAGCSSRGAIQLDGKPDYSLSTMWFDTPNDTLMEADIFYIAPTCIWDWEDAEGKIYHHMNVDNREQRSRVDGSHTPWPMPSSENIAVSMRPITARLRWSRG